VTHVDGVVQSIRDGKLAVLPTDTVYGLVCAASHREPAADLYRLKGRAAIQPTAVVFGAVGVISKHLPELDSRVLAIVEELLAGVAASVVERLEAVVATSANLRGGQDPRTLAEVPPEILAGVAAAVDGGELPGTPSTVIDVTGVEPLIIRAGAGDPARALARVVAARA
jgi:L-threonylcarbamoyladenylate synthase